MPVLLAESVRASDVLISNGKRVKINWRMELLEEWKLSPPSYKVHTFHNKTMQTGLERSKSTSSQSPSATATSSSGPQSSRSILGAGGDQIEVVGSELANLKVSEVVSMKEQSLPTPAVAAEIPRLDEKAREVNRQSAEVHGVVFCF